MKTLQRFAKKIEIVCILLYMNQLYIGCYKCTNWVIRAFAIFMMIGSNKN